ncbi:MAG: hypothetical protein ACHWZW_23410 [Spirulina sp.]
MCPLVKPLLPRWTGIAIYGYAFVAIGIAEAGLGVLLPSILVAYGLTPATVTLLFISQISGYITAALTSSVVTERLGLGKMLLLAASLLTGALLTYALSPTWGLTVAAMFPKVIWLIPKRLPEAMVPAAVSFATSAASVGAALIPAGVGWVSVSAGLEVVPLLMLPLAITLAGLHGWLVRSA